MYDTIIIGASFAGLSAAALLSQKNKKVLAIEKQPYMGGRAFYKEDNGFIWQYGQHSHRLGNNGIASKLFKELREKIDFLEVKVKQAESVSRAKQVLDKLSSIIKNNYGKINLNENVTEIKIKNINNLFIIGDTVKGDGCSGDISFSSALELNKIL